MISETELTELERLADAATKGPWDASDNYVLSDVLNGERGKIVAECFAGNPVYGDNCNDTHFIAAARDAVPKLIVECRRLRAALLLR